MNAAADDGIFDHLTVVDNQLNDRNGSVFVIKGNGIDRIRQKIVCVCSHFLDIKLGTGRNIHRKYGKSAFVDAHDLKQSVLRDLRPVRSGQGLGSTQSEANVLVFLTESDTVGIVGFQLFEQADHDLLPFIDGGFGNSRDLNLFTGIGKLRLYRLL